jgi:hypothetical protein
MNKILELSKKIYDYGFMTENEQSLRELCKDLSLDENSLDIDFTSPELAPIYSSDWCWNILPDEIEVEKESERLHPADDVKTWLEKYSFDIDLDTVAYINFEGIKEVEFSICNTSLHEALLQMVCWCIENDYIKREVLR